MTTPLRPGDVVTHSDPEFPGEFVVEAVHASGTVTTTHPRSFVLLVSNLTLVRPGNPPPPPFAQSIASRIREMDDLVAAGMISRDAAAMEKLRIAPRPRKPRMLLIDRLGFERIDEWSGGHSHFIAVPRSGGHLTVRFDREGYSRRDGEEMVLFREVSAEHERPRLFIEPPRPPKLTVDKLARALFETDPDVIAFLDRVGEWLPQHEVAGPRRLERRWSRARAKAWERNENGWRERAEQRAAAMFTGPLYAMDAT